MNLFVLLLVSSLALSALAKETKDDKIVKKRGLIEFHTPGQHHSGYHHQGGFQNGQGYDRNAHSFAGPVQTVIKQIPVPYERHIHIDNPIYTQVERHIPIDNPVPVTKIIKQQYPLRVEEPYAVPVYKHVHVAQPYVHKVHLVLQDVYVSKQKQPEATYLPAAQPHMNYLPPQGPDAHYLPPSPAFNEPQSADHYNPGPIHSQIESVAPPATKYGVPDHQSHH